MKQIKKFFKKTGSFFNSLDTITTKLLILVLCCVTIPLVVVANFSTDIINQSIIDNSTIKLNTNRKIFEKKLQDDQIEFENTLKKDIKEFLTRYGEKDDIEKPEFLEYLYQNNSKPDFVIVIDKQRKIKTYKSKLDPNLILKSLSKMIPIVYTGNNQTFVEKIKDNIFQVSIIPVLDDENILSIIIAGNSLKKTGIVQHVNNITGASVAIYTIEDKKPEIITVSDNISGLKDYIEVSNSSLSKHNAFNFAEKSIHNPADYYINFPITNFYNNLIGKVYIGVSKFDFIIWADKNYKIISIITVISLLSAIVIAALFARMITDPILALKEAAESINLGNLDFKLDIKGNDETVKLAKSFNRMVKNLERDERLRDNFIATLTHDLKVPMLAENQTISFLLKETYGPLTEEQKEVLDLMKSTNISSLEMIGTLLEVYRYDCGNVKLFLSRFNLIEVINESIEQIKSLADDKKIQINFNFSRDDIIIEADRRDIKRLIHNLVSNSINHGIHRGYVNCNIEIAEDKIIFEPKNDINVYNSLKSPIEITNCILVSFEDNGVGINREDMSLLFNRFSLSKGRKPAGSGLGLYYARQVVNMHGGRIWAESSETGGSIFRFTLPLNKQD